MGRSKRPSARRWRSTGWVPDERAARRRQLEADTHRDEDEIPDEDQEQDDRV